MGTQSENKATVILVESIERRLGVIYENYAATMFLDKNEILNIKKELIELNKIEKNKEIQKVLEKIDEIIFFGPEYKKRHLKIIK